MITSKYIKDFLAYLEVAQNKSRKTMENYTHYLQRFEGFLAEELNPKNLTLQKIQNYRLYLNRYKD